MFTSYFKIAWRNIVKHKTYAAIHIAGFAAGMTVALLIGLWVWDELSFDITHHHYNRLAQVMDVQTINGEKVTSEAISIPLAEELRTKYAGDFKQVAIIHPPFVHTVAAGDKKLSAPGIWAQPDLPAMLTLKMIQGRQDALKDPSSVLISATLAKAMFGNADPLNQPFKMDNRTDLQVGGVFEDLPQNTSFHDVQLFLSWDKGVSTLEWLQKAQTEWDNRYWKLYVLLNDKTDIDKASEKIRNVIRQHVNGATDELILHPMSKWHLYGEFKNGQAASGRIRLVWLIGIIGAFVLLMACINFMNLSTAASVKRAKEVGIRKAIGSLRGQLIGQFLGESLVLACLAFILTLVIVLLSLPYFNTITEKQLSIPFTSPLFWIVVAGFVLVTGLIAGSYPAFYLSSFRPVKVLKGTLKAGRYAALPRKALLVVQFTTSAILITGTIIVYLQLQHAKNRPVGYTREGLITLKMNTAESYGAPYNALRNALLQTGAVAEMGKSSTRSTEEPYDNTDFNWKGRDPAFVPQMGIVGVTHDYGHTIGWQVKEGRDFSRSFATDTGNVIINETAARLIGLPHPVGETLHFNGKDRIITGVVKDMVMGSPYQPVQPTVFYLGYDWLNALTIRIQPTLPLQEALAKIEPVCKQFNPAAPFDYTFTDTEYAQKFSDEERTGRLATIFAVLAIFISCLGLFGLAAFMAEQRKKEIGVRKVLGASVLNVLGLLSKDFVMLVILSLIIASPIAYYCMHSWLQQYAYRTALPWWVFGVTAIGALVITIVTISYQAMKAALRNPVESLRSE